MSIFASWGTPRIFPRQPYRSTHRTTKASVVACRKGCSTLRSRQLSLRPSKVLLPLAKGGSPLSLHRLDRGVSPRRRRHTLRQTVWRRAAPADARCRTVPTEGFRGELHLGGHICRAVRGPTLAERRGGAVLPLGRISVRGAKGFGEVSEVHIFANALDLYTPLPNSTSDTPTAADPCSSERRLQ